MAAVETVQGPVEGDELGVTLIHEHVRFRDESVAHQWPRAYSQQDEHTAAIEAVNAAAGHGVETICDPTVMFGGRNVRFMQRVAEETGVRIVASTGIYTYDYLPHYFANRDADAMADLFVADIEEGI
ncbi:MAG: phosphotriesterase, partial [Actinobacteria bacterium]|nr:phosphotriesterase [Actinomycetota bacterium]